MAKPKNTRFPFTDVSLGNLKADTRDYDCRDKGAPGLTLRVSPSGKKTFRWTYRDIDGKHRVKSLGAYPGLGLADARKKLEAEKVAHQQSLELGQTGSKPETVKDLAEEFYSDHILANRKHPEDVRRMLDTDIIKRLGKLRLSPLPPAKSIATMIKKVVERGAPIYAGRVLNVTKQMFDFGVSLDYLEANPAGPLKPKYLGVQEGIARDRTLDNDGIRDFWLALDGPHRIGHQTRAALRLLLLTGARTGELIRAKWEHVDLEAATWTIPPENQKLTKAKEKKAKDFIIPLAPLAIEQFEQLKLFAGEREWVMASEGREGHYSRKSLGQALARLFKIGILTIPEVSPHDLRRTMRSQLGEVLNVEPHIAERCLNHSMGKLTETYDRGIYMKQRRKAMEQWADQVELYVLKPYNVSLIRGGAA